MRWLRQWLERRRRRSLERVLIPDETWREVCRIAVDRYRLDDTQRRRLRELASLFQHRKAINGAAGAALDPLQRALISALACLPILELGLDWYRGWSEVIVYADTFVSNEEFVDEAGVIHREPSVREGESWDRGPVILSWADLERDLRYPEDCCNLAIHEFAHKLDQLTGAANGQPPLHRGMNAARWSAVLQHAYDGLVRADERGEACPIDPYAAESPAEFFAVASEYFFEAPARLIAFDAPVYEQLALFYRQDPARRAAPGAPG